MNPEQVKHIQSVEENRMDDFPSRRTDLTLRYLLLAKIYYANNKFQAYLYLVQAIMHPAKYHEVNITV